MSRTVVEIRRYPVKAMGGEPLESVDLDARGLAMDRWFAVVDEDGKLATGKSSGRFRRFDEVFEYAAQVVDDEVVVSACARSWPVGAELDQVLSVHLGADVTVRPEAEVPHQDDGQVSLVGTASLDWCREHLGVDADRRRIRPNLVVETTEPFVEETWGGATIRVGGAELRILERIERCRMIDIAQEGLGPEGGWLKGLGRTRDLSLGMYAEVVQPGRVTVGDPVGLLPVKDSAGD